MAAFDYIIESDITNVHIKEFVTAGIFPAELITEANDYYEDVALQLGVLIDDLVIPVPLTARRMILEYVTFRFSEDSMGTNNVEITENDMYVRMMEEADKALTGLRAQLTPQFIKGTSDNNRKARTVRSTRLWRTS